MFRDYHTSLIKGLRENRAALECGSIRDNVRERNSPLGEFFLLVRGNDIFWQFSRIYTKIY